MCDKKFAIASLVCILTVSFTMLIRTEVAYALPWDHDMYRQQSYQPGELSRAPAPNTHPVGREKWTLTTEEAGNTLKNPTPISRDSVWRGRLLWETNCKICHGSTGKGDGRVGPPLLPVPSLLESTYVGRTDGHIYGTIMNGGALMPRYGYKFSDAERWDVINYLRFLQGTEVAGFPRSK